MIVVTGLAISGSISAQSMDMNMDMNGMMNGGFGTEAPAQKNNSPKVNPAKSVSVTATAPKGAAVDLKYKFKKGAKYRYKVTDNSSISIKIGGMPGMDGMPGMGNMGGMGMPGMNAGGMDQKFRTESDFTMKIVKVHGDGSADFITTVNSFNAFMLPSNQLMASAKGIKKSALRVKGKITAKGQVTFLEDVYLIVTENNETLLVSQSAKINKDGSATTSQTARAGDEEVTLKASFDPKTGRVSAKVTTKKIKKVKRVKKVKVTQKDKRVDILPKQFMTMLELPAGKMAPGSNVTVKMPMTQADLLLISYKNGIAEVETTLKTGGDVSKDQSDAAGMGMAQMGEAQGMMPKISGKIKARFDQKRGVLKSVSGKITTSIKAGVEMKTSSDVMMKLQ